MLREAFEWSPLCVSQGLRHLSRHSPPDSPGPGPSSRVLHGSDPAPCRPAGEGALPLPLPCRGLEQKLEPPGLLSVTALELSSPVSTDTCHGCLHDQGAGELQLGLLWAGPRQLPQRLALAPAGDSRVCRCSRPVPGEPGLSGMCTCEYTVRSAADGKRFKIKCLIGKARAAPARTRPVRAAKAGSFQELRGALPPALPRPEHGVCHGPGLRRFISVNSDAIKPRTPKKHIFKK